MPIYSKRAPGRFLKGEAMTTLTKRRFRAAEVHSMIDYGVLRPEERVELLDGDVFEAAAAGSRHAACVNRLTRVLMQEVGERALVSVQNSMDLSEYSVPEPDLGLFEPRGDYYEEALPSSGAAFVLIEVSDTTLRQDRSLKLKLYARAGIPEYWIVHLRKRAVEVCREPAGDGYLSREVLLDGDELTALRLLDLRVPVSALFAPLPAG